MSLDTIIKDEQGASAASYGKNANRERNPRRQQSKPYQRQQRQPRQQQQQQQQQQSHSVSGANPAFPFPSQSMTAQQQQQLQSLLSMPLSSFPHMLQQLPMLVAGMQSFPQSALPFPLQLPGAGASSVATGADMGVGGAGDQLDASGSSSSRTLKVSSQSNPKTVAGAIAHTSRQSSPPQLLATGTDAVNQAVKAIAIARGYLETDHMELSVKSEFRDEERGAISLTLNKSNIRGSSKHKGVAGGAAAASTSQPAAAGSEEKEVEESELRVAKESEPSMTAGSIAKKIRAGERVSIVSIGAGSVSATVRAITIARRYLESDSLDLSFKPGFVHLEMAEGQRSAIKFVILAQQV